MHDDSQRGWNFAELWETAAGIRGAADALVHGERRVSWGELDRRANGLAASLLDAGLDRQAKVAVYLYSRPEYLIAYAAAFKAGLVPCNVNFRYKSAEVAYILDNADAEAVVFDRAFAEVLEEVRTQLPAVRRWICVDGGEGPPPWAQRWEEAAAERPAFTPPWPRSGEDLFLLYTGGTTGLPKGVMWPQDTVVRLIHDRTDLRGGQAPPADLADYAGRLVHTRGDVLVPTCPLMHGTGLFNAYAALLTGGTVALLAGRSFDAEELLTMTERWQATAWAIVGDPFARPVADALDAAPQRWSLDSLQRVRSSGAMWSEEVKRRLLAHAPHLTLVDAYSSSEAVSMATAVSTAGQTQPTAHFNATERAAVLADDGSLVSPGSGEVGALAVADLLPFGYYKDPVKTAGLFREVGGRRYALSGDLARVAADGSLEILGRGSACINTGGEKVYPEEVEETLKSHPAVRDAVCVGVADPQWGEAVTAVVDAAEPVSEVELVDHIKARLAAYKAPKRVVFAPVPRSPAGKPDYDGAAELAGSTPQRESSGSERG